MTARILIFKTTLKPNQTQEQALARSIGSARFTHNCILSAVFTNFAEQKERAESDRKYQSVSTISLRNLWVHELRAEYAPWASEVSGDAFDSGVITSSDALQRWLKKQTKAPRYHKRQSDDSVAFGNNSKLRSKGKAVRLAKIGEVRINERLKAADWLVRCGAKLTAVTIRKQAGQWVASLRIKVPERLYEQYLLGRHYRKTTVAVGLDLGLEKYITTSDSEFAVNPRYFRAEAKKLKKSQQRVVRRKSESKRREKAQLRVQKIHKRIADLRNNHAHQLSRELVNQYSFIAVENLNIKGMLKNRRLAKSISDASWGSFIGLLEYKLERCGGKLVKIDRWFPSSKTCSDCGQVKPKLDLNDRVYDCDHCKLSIDRDINAAINILNKGSAGYAEHIGQLRASAFTCNKPSKEGSLLQVLSTDFGQNASQAS